MIENANIFDALIGDENSPTFFTPMFLVFKTSYLALIQTAIAKGKDNWFRTVVLVYYLEKFYNEAKIILKSY